MVCIEQLENSSLSMGQILDWRSSIHACTSYDQSKMVNTDTSGDLFPQRIYRFTYVMVMCLVIDLVDRYLEK